MTVKLLRTIESLTKKKERSKIKFPIVSSIQVYYTTLCCDDETKEIGEQQTVLENIIQ